MAIYLVTIPLFDDEDLPVESLKSDMEEILTDAGFIWGTIDFQKAKIIPIEEEN